jgi:hypothetical protein
MALAQGSGELIWWPYLMAKYGLAFLFLLLPACLLQYPVCYEIGRYTLLTGESIFQGFTRLNRYFSLFLWLLMTVSFLWFGAFAAAGGTSLAALTGFPTGWSNRGQTLFWAYASMSFFLLAILLSKVIYELIEKFMWAVAVVTVIGLVWACSSREVIQAIPLFLRGLVIPNLPPTRPWNPADSTKLLTAITFAGLGGFWTLFYSYWLRDKGVGMAFHMGRITGPIKGKPEVITASGFTFPPTLNEARKLRKWKSFLIVDIGIGIGGNLVTTLMTCLLGYALLFPKGLLPDRYEIAVVQSLFFEASWGWGGKVIFLIVAAAFLADTWMATIDGVSRIHADCLHCFFPNLRKWSIRKLYMFFLVVLTVITASTILLDEPGPLIQLSAVIGFVGTVLFSLALLILNHFFLSSRLPEAARPGIVSRVLLILSCTAYTVMAMVYLKLLLGN